MVAIYKDNSNCDTKFMLFPENVENSETVKCILTELFLLKYFSWTSSSSKCSNSHIYAAVLTFLPLCKDQSFWWNAIIGSINTQ